MEVLQRTANRGSIATGGYDITNSLKLERANSEQVRATGTTDSGNRKTWTFSTWIKRTEISYNGGFGINALFYAASTGIQINSNDKISIRMYTGAAYTGDLLTTQVFRDTSAWYHIVWTLDTTEATASNRIKLWINGQQVTDFDTEVYPNLNDEFQIGQASSAAPIRIGNAYWGTSPFSAYIAETHYLNGTAKQASDFGEYDADSGIWIPKEYTDGGYGDIGFYYKYDNASSLGEDSSGEGHDANGLVNITSADQATDTPTNNFCTWNPLWAYPNTATVGNGGTSSIGGASSVWRGSKGTIGLTNGKWYWEQKANGNDTIVGWQTENVISVTGTNAHNVNDTIALYEAGNYIWLRDETSGRNDTAASGSYANGQIVGFALDLDSSPQTATFYRNGSAIASNVNIDGLTGKTIFPFTSHYQQTSNANFGGYTNISDAHTNTDENGYGAFVYTPPSGYYAICTKNLAEYG